MIELKISVGLNTQAHIILIPNAPNPQPLKRLLKTRPVHPPEESFVKIFLNKFHPNRVYINKSCRYVLYKTKIVIGIWQVHFFDDHVLVSLSENITSPEGTVGMIRVSPGLTSVVSLSGTMHTITAQSQRTRNTLPPLTSPPPTIPPQTEHALFKPESRSQLPALNPPASGQPLPLPTDLQCTVTQPVSGGTVTCVSFNVCFGCMDKTKTEDDRTAHWFASPHCKNGECLINFQQLLQGWQSGAGYDFLGLQEASMHVAMFKHASTKYKQVHWPDNKNSLDTPTVCLSYNDQRYSLLAHAGMELCPTLDDLTKSNLTGIVGMQKNGRPAQYALFHSINGKRYGVINLHNWHTARHTENPIERKTWRNLLALKLSQLVSLVEEAPDHLIAMGDFNDHHTARYFFGLDVIHENNGEKRTYSLSVGNNFYDKTRKHITGVTWFDQGQLQTCYVGSSNQKSVSDYAISDLPLIGMSVINYDQASNKQRLPVSDHLPIVVRFSDGGGSAGGGGAQTAEGNALALAALCITTLVASFAAA